MKTSPFLLCLTGLSLVSVIGIGLWVSNGHLPGFAQAVEESSEFPESDDLVLIGKQQGQTTLAPPLGIVYLFLSTECPISHSYIPTLNELCESYSPTGVRFFGVVSGSVTQEEVIAYQSEYQIRFPIFWDRHHHFAQQFKATHTPQTILIDTNNRVQYTGRIDDRFVDLGKQKLSPVQEDFREALRAFVIGQPIPIAKTEPVGCVIESLTNEETGTLTFTEHIAPLLYRHCTRCHRAGEAAPFELLTYDDAKSHAEQIRLVVKRRLMPPWKPELNFGHFQNEARLTDKQIELISEWVTNGTPEGPSDALPSPPEFETGWQMGTPDLELIMPEAFEVPADGPDIYQHFVIPTGLVTDRLVQAFEFRPGSPEVVHHAILYLDNTGQGRKLDDADPSPGYSLLGSPGFPTSGSLGGWGPGGTPRKLPNGMGRPLARKSDLVLQIHYHPVGKPVKDVSRVGLYFAPKTAGQLVTEIMVADVDLEIPAGEANHIHSASYTLPVATTLLDVTPHMHVLGKEIQATAHLPDGSTWPLIRIQNWDFYWQDHYVYHKPIRLPAGTRIDLECRFDNSADNPLNPNSPPKPVYWGDFSTDEMGICYFQVTTDTIDEYRTLSRDASDYFLNAWKNAQERQKEREHSQSK